jgi:glycosyltransferase involved in cell wall biosynthesis
MSRRLAWFSPVPPDRSGIAAYTAELLPRLAPDFDLDVYVDAVPAGPQAVLEGARSLRSAHEFVTGHTLDPYPLVVYQLGNAACHDYMWPYLLRYPGLVVLHDAVLHHARARALLSRGRGADYRHEFAWSHPEARPGIAGFAVAGLKGAPYYLWPHIRLPVERARAVAVHARPLADMIAEGFPGATVIPIRMGVGPVEAPPPASGTPVVFACFGRVTPEKRIEQVLRAVGEARQAVGNARLVLVGEVAPYYDLAADIARFGLEDAVTVTGYVSDADLRGWLAAADVCLCLRWPTARESSASWLRCLAAGRPTVVTDLIQSLDVPVLDPRSWTIAHAQADAAAARQPPRPAEAVAVAIDILDEDHSLGLALTRLASDAALRRQLGRRARAWWQTHHQLDHMASDYRSAIDAALARPIPPPPADLPSHLLDDGGGQWRRVAGEMGLEADAFGW